MTTRRGSFTINGATACAYECPESFMHARACAGPYAANRHQLSRYDKSTSYLRTGLGIRGKIGQLLGDKIGLVLLTGAIYFRANLEERFQEECRTMGLVRYVTLCCRDEEDVAWTPRLCFRYAVHATLSAFELYYTYYVNTVQSIDY